MACANIIPMLSGVRVCLHAMRVRERGRFPLLYIAAAQSSIKQKKAPQHAFAYDCPDKRSSIQGTKCVRALLSRKSISGGARSGGSAGFHTLATKEAKPDSRDKIK